MYRGRSKNLTRIEGRARYGSSHGYQPLNIAAKKSTPDIGSVSDTSLILCDILKITSMCLILGGFSFLHYNIP